MYCARISYGASESGETTAMRTLCLIAWRLEVPHNLRHSVFGVPEGSAAAAGATNATPVVVQLPPADGRHDNPVPVQRLP